MRVIIAGSREIKDYHVVKRVIESAQFPISKVLSGRADGVDRLGERWAEENRITVEYYPADWKNQGRSAGPIRNEKMAKNADALIAIWDGKSSGTKNMITLAEKYGLLIYTEIVGQEIKVSVPS